MPGGPFYFSWCGGPLVPPFALQTTADVWGGSVQTLASIWGGLLSTQGDISGGNIISELTTVDGLVVGQTYLIRGKGIPTSADGVSGDTFFQYDGGTGGILTQESDTGIGVSLIITSDDGRELVQLASTAGLRTGVTYGISGSGIPSGTTFTFDGGAVAHISQPAETTGLASVRMTSTLDRDQLLNIADTTGLTVGQTYNLFGQGIPASATAVYEGGSTLQMSAEGTQTVTAATVLISRGASYPDGGGFDPEQHLREDVDVLGLEISHTEGDFATASVEIRNTGKGLLAPDQQLWAWLSWDSGGGTIVPLLHGRLVGVPADLEKEVIRLQLLARPEDFEAQKVALAASMRVPPYWDPVWLIEHEADPDTVLEARTMLWHIDRTALVLTASDIINGEDGTLAIGEDQHLYDSMSVSYTGAPLRRINVTATVTWTQTGIGDVDLTPQLWGAFNDVGSTMTYPIVCSLTGDGLKSSWPAAFTNIGGGWSVGSEAAVSDATWVRSGRYPSRYIDKAAEAKPQQDKTTTSAYDPTRPIDIASNPMQLTTYGPTQIPGQAAMLVAGYKTYDVLFDLNAFAINFPVHYEAARSRSEVLNFSLEADVQSILTEPGTTETQALSLSSDFIGQPVDPGGAMPIGDLRRNCYFPTDRGQQSVQYLLALARAKLVAKARAVVIKFVVPWSLGVGLSCRWNVALTDRRLPGGVATGKVTAYTLTARPGAPFAAAVTIACTVGHGVPLGPAAEGTGTYIDDDYVDVGMQERFGGQVELLPGELLYQSFDDMSVIDDDGVDLFNLNPDTIIQSLYVLGGKDEQQAAIDSAAGLIPSATAGASFTPMAALQLTPTRVNLELVPVTGGAFQSNFFMMTSELVLPQTINLESPA